ncbi:HNH endonuclease signature motif containing protein [Streptomyces sp. NPDC047046]|uniref:HNH endonuclease signature motif containing protein n=1 Tax=Streptomyces sp. NPDC047046 TaxID=3155378 RepID=UPI00340EBAB8
MSAVRYPRSVLAAEAPGCGSIVELMGRVGAPLSRTSKRYVEQRLQHYGIDVSHFRPCELPVRAPVLYSREALTEAVAGARSLREVGERLGLPDGDIPYSHVRRRLDHFGIDSSHLSQRGAPDSFASEDEVRDAVAGAQSVAEALRALGKEVNTNTRRRLRNACERHALSTAHFLGQASRRGIPAQRKPAAEVLVVKPPEAGRTSGERLRRALDETGRSHLCARCGLGEEWQGEELVLELDHINGDWRDNRAENLRYLCPNCHRLTATYGNLVRYSQ